MENYIWYVYLSYVALEVNLVWDYTCNVCMRYKTIGLWDSLPLVSWAVEVVT